MIMSSKLPSDSPEGSGDRFYEDGGHDGATAPPGGSSSDWEAQEDDRIQIDENILPKWTTDSENERSASRNTDQAIDEDVEMITASEGEGADEEVPTLEEVMDYRTFRCASATAKPSAKT